MYFCDECILALPRIHSHPFFTPMTYETTDLIRDIRIAIDQNTSSQQLVLTGDIDTLSLDEIIESKIADAARIVESSAPLHLLDSGEAFGNSVGWKSRVGYGMGFVRLPEDFMRLITFQMSDWVRAVSTPITENDPLYIQQQSRYPGIRGCPQNPIVAIVEQPIGLVLEFYSCTGGEDVFIKRARYIPTPRIVDGSIEICEKLRSAVVYYAAYLTALTTAQGELAAGLLNTANELMK